MNLAELIRAQAVDEAEDAPTPPRRYTVSADPKAIANLERLQANRPLKPPGK